MTGFDRMKFQLVEALQMHLLRPHKAPKIPDAGVLLWQAFLELDAARQFHAHGPCPISFAEIEAWCRVKRYPLQPRHVDVLQAMDAEMVRHLYALASGKKGAAPGPARKRRPAMTPALFDAMFL